MAEITRKFTHKRAKGRTIHAKPTRRTTGRAGARSRRTAGPRKTASAEAQKRKKKTATRKRPRNLAANLHPVDHSPATAAQPVPEEKLGLERLMEAIDKLMTKRSDSIASTLADQIAKGNAGCTKVAVGLAEKVQRKREMERDQGRLQGCLHQLENEPEFKDPEEDIDSIDRSEPGIVETIHAVVDCGSII